MEKRISSNRNRISRFILCNSNFLFECCLVSPIAANKPDKAGTRRKERERERASDSCLYSVSPYLNMQQSCYCSILLHCFAFPRHFYRFRAAFQQYIDFLHRRVFGVLFHFRLAFLLGVCVYRVTIVACLLVISSITLVQQFFNAKIIRFMFNIHRIFFSLVVFFLISFVLFSHRKREKSWNNTAITSESNNEYGCGKKSERTGITDNKKKATVESRRIIHKSESVKCSKIMQPTAIPNWIKRNEIIPIVYTENGNTNTHTPSCTAQHIHRQRKIDWDTWRVSLLLKL